MCAEPSMLGRRYPRCLPATRTIALQGPSRNVRERHERPQVMRICLSCPNGTSAYSPGQAAAPEGPGLPWVTRPKALPERASEMCAPGRRPGRRDACVTKKTCGARFR